MVHLFSNLIRKLTFMTNYNTLYHQQELHHVLPCLQGNYRFLIFHIDFDNSRVFEWLYYSHYKYTTSKFTHLLHLLCYF